MLIRLLRGFLRPYARQIGVVVVLLVAQTVGNLYLPNLNADIINNGVVLGNLPYILRTGAAMLGITLAVGVVAIVAVYWSSRVAMGAGRDIRAAVFACVQAFSARDMDRFGTPSLITRNTNDIQQIQLFLQMALTLMVIAPIMSVGGVILAVREGAALSPSSSPRYCAANRLHKNPLVAPSHTTNPSTPKATARMSPCTEPATALPANDPGSQARYGKYSINLGRAAPPYRCSTGFRKFNDTMDSTNNPMNSSRVLRFARHGLWRWWTFLAYC